MNHTLPTEPHQKHPRANVARSNPTGRLLVAWIILSLMALASSARAQTIPLGVAEDFAVLGGSTVTNTGPTVITTGDVGVSPGTAITGFPPGTVVGGTIRSNDAAAQQAHLAAASAFNQVRLELPTVNLTGQNLGGLTLTPGIYRFNSNAQLTGTLNLDTGGDPNAQFHFQIGTDLTTATNSSVVLLNGVSTNIFWQIGTSATLGTNSLFAGTIIADQSITLNTGAELVGRALAINGAVTLDSNRISLPLLLPVLPLATGSVWNGVASNLWSGLNWSPSVAGGGTSTLAPAADVVFSVTGVTPQNQNTVVDVNTTISSLTVNDPTAVTISGPGVLSIVGGGAATGITINPGAGLTTINSNLALSGPAQAVTVNNAAGLIINGAVSGVDGLTKEGTGDLVLTGVNTYTGNTTILAGSLGVDGSVAGSAIVAGGRLRGTGTIGGSVLNQALVQPGGATVPGRLTIGGNFNQSPAGTLSIRLASPTSYDLLTIGGAAFLSGALNVSYLDGFNAQIGDTFTILTAGGGVSGRFASFNDAHATGTLLGLELVYEDNAVLLRFVQGSFVDNLPALPPNELAVARALDRLAANNPNDALIRELNLLQLAQLTGALRLLSPEDFAAIFNSGLAISQVQIGNLERRLDEVRQGGSGFSDSGFAVTDSHGAQNYDGKSAMTLDGKSSVGLDGKSSKEVVEMPEEREHRWGFFISGRARREFHHGRRHHRRGLSRQSASGDRRRIGLCPHFLRLERRRRPRHRQRQRQPLRDALWRRILPQWHRRRRLRLDRHQAPHLRRIRPRRDRCDRLQRPARDWLRLPPRRIHLGPRGLGAILHRRHRRLHRARRAGRLADQCAEPGVVEIGGWPEGFLQPTRRTRGAHARPARAVAARISRRRLDHRRGIFVPKFVFRPRPRDRPRRARDRRRPLRTGLLAGGALRLLHRRTRT
jgi:autotransporter-associated beta strand protein